MYIRDGIAYAGEPEMQIRVTGVRAMEGRKLWLRFNTGETKVFDVTPLLLSPAFAPLAEEAAFYSVYLDYGTVAWMDGEIDIAPERLYRDGVTAEKPA